MAWRRAAPQENRILVRRNTDRVPHVHGETEDADFVLRGNAEHGVRRIRTTETTACVSVRGRELGSMERKADQKFKPAIQTRLRLTWSLSQSREDGYSDCQPRRFPG